jgi:hypothetical protein
MIPEDDYADHIETCMTKPLARSTNTKKPKPYRDESPPKSKDNWNTKACIICFEEIATADYVAHVNACLSETPSCENTKPPADTEAGIICSKEIAKADCVDHIDICLRKPLASPTVKHSQPFYSNESLFCNDR